MGWKGWTQSIQLLPKINRDNDICGIFFIGICYQNGIGVEKDEHKAFIYYQKSAEMDPASGISRVAECCRNGIGITRDLNKSKYWYQR